MTQKDAVLQEVLQVMPNFRFGVDIALNVLSKSQIDSIKTNIAQGILNGVINYSKNRSLAREVYSYAKSMVTHHLSRAKELTGGTSSSEGKLICAVDLSSLSEEFQRFLKDLTEDNHE